MGELISDRMLAQLDKNVKETHSSWMTSEVVYATDLIIFKLKDHIKATGEQPDWSKYPTATGEYNWRLSEKRHPSDNCGPGELQPAPVEWDEYRRRTISRTGKDPDITGESLGADIIGDILGDILDDDQSVGF